jgi:hypothetical protein
MPPDIARAGAPRIRRRLFEAPRFASCCYCEAQRSALRQAHFDFLKIPEAVQNAYADFIRLAAATSNGRPRETSTYARFHSEGKVQLTLRER